MNTPSMSKKQLLTAASQQVLLIVGLLSFAVNLLLLTVPLYMLQVYDRVLAARSADTLLMLTLLAVGLLIAYGTLDAVRQRIMVRVAARYEQKEIGDVFGALVERRILGERGVERQALGDVHTVRNFLSSPSFLSFFDLPWMPLFIGLIFLLHPTLGMVAVTGMMVLVAIAIAGEFLTRSGLQEGNSQIHQSKQFAEQILRHSETVFAMGMEGAAREKWNELRMSGLQHQVPAQDWSSMLSGGSKMMRLLMQLAILGVGAWLAINEIITPGVMIAASIILGRALAPLEAAIVGWKQFISARSAYSRLTGLLQETRVASASMQLPAPTGRLSVEKVFGAAPRSENPYVQNIDFSLEPGEVLGLIGPSAAGKTMLARLLVGIWKPTQGVVRLDGVNIAEWNRAELGPYIGYLSQEISLVGDTIAHTIARCGAVDHEMVVEAAQKCNIHEMILTLPNGYDTELGDEGCHLSAGQRQRLGLARAIYGNPKFIVLDEPNSNLDGEGEAALHTCLSAMKALGTTTVIISHRASALTLADKIIVLKDGLQEHFGPRDDVLSKIVRRVEDRPGEGSSSAFTRTVAEGAS